MWGQPLGHSVPWHDLALGVPSHHPFFRPGSCRASSLPLLGILLLHFQSCCVTAALLGSLRMVGVKLVDSYPGLQQERSSVGSRFAVVKFTMWECRPCLRIAPAFSTMGDKYPQAIFLEIDVQQCQGTAATNNISASPTFCFCFLKQSENWSISRSRCCGIRRKKSSST